MKNFLGDSNRQPRIKNTELCPALSQDFSLLITSSDALKFHSQTTTTTNPSQKAGQWQWGTCL